MSNYHRILRESLLTAAVSLLAAFFSCAQAAKSGSELPAWLAAKIGEFEAMPVERAPLEIWRIIHKGQPAYFFVAPCCDHLNPLFSASGQQLCSPSGGLDGGGDGKCPIDARRRIVHQEKS